MLVVLAVLIVQVSDLGADVQLLVQIEQGDDKEEDRNGTCFDGGGGAGGFRLSNRNDRTVEGTVAEVQTYIKTSFTWGW